MKKYLIIGIVLLIICLGLVIYNEFINAPISINDITNVGAKTVDKKAYLDATFVAGTITGDDMNSYYVMFGDGVQYIVYINNNKANVINNYLLDNPDKSYRIEGTTKLIPSDMEENGKKFVKEWLDKNHNHSETEESHSHEITTLEFYQYFGYVYLDNTINNNVLQIFIYATGLVGILFIMSFIVKKYRLYE